MLDTFEILTTSGVVLWSRTYVPVGANVINSLIRDVFIEERIQPQAEDAGSKPTYKKEGYTLKWTAAKDLGLIFVVRLWHSKSMSAHMQWLTSPGGIPKPGPPHMDRQTPRQCARPLRGSLRRATQDGTQQRGQLRQVCFILRPADARVGRRERLRRTQHQAHHPRIEHGQR
jgi:hypothetical protein